MIQWVLASAVTFCIALFASMLLCTELGRWLGRRRTLRDETGRIGSATIEAAIFALFGLLLAFTFSGAASRFDERRALIVSEANAIGTAWLRLDLLPPASQPPLRAAFRSYVEARARGYANAGDGIPHEADFARAVALQKQIWTLAVAAGTQADAPPAANILLLPALNEMIDITTTRTMATRMHPPTVIYFMLVGLALAGAVIAGFGMADGKSRQWFHRLSYAAVMTLAIYVIVDLEHPRLGFIRVDSFDHLLADAVA